MQAARIRVMMLTCVVMTRQCHATLLADDGYNDTDAVTIDASGQVALPVLMNTVVRQYLGVIPRRVRWAGEYDKYSAGHLHRSRAPPRCDLTTTYLGQFWL